MGLGLGLENNVGIKTRNHKLQVPPVWAVLELPIRHNLGVGIAAGAMRWSPKASNGNETFSYYSIAPRVSYHFNIASRFDLYTGVALIGRMIKLDAERDGQPFSINNKKIDAGLLLGARYYFRRVFGIYGEYGNDNVACARLGIALRFGR
jgi:hypothetical protein